VEKGLKENEIETTASRLKKKGKAAAWSSKILLSLSGTFPTDRIGREVPTKRARRQYKSIDEEMRRLSR